MMVISKTDGGQIGREYCGNLGITETNESPVIYIIIYMGVFTG